MTWTGGDDVVTGCQQKGRRGKKRKDTLSHILSTYLRSLVITKDGK